jgi:hypothetical protein
MWLHGIYLKSPDLILDMEMARRGDLHPSLVCIYRFFQCIIFLHLLVLCSC